MRVLRCLTIFASLSIVSNALAQGEQPGTVTNVDESSGSITIQRIPDGTVGSSTGTNSAKFAVQDAMLFNALTQGDEVTFRSQRINGVNTIIKIQKR
jgi:Cu/Ag efflux protein CusF